MGYQPPDRLTPKERRNTLIYAGGWLVFLLTALPALTAGDAGLGAKALGWAGLLVFIASYLCGMVYPRPVARLPRMANTTGFMVVMFAGLVMMFPAVGHPVLFNVPYFVALWVFNHTLRTGLGATVVILFCGGLGIWALGGDARPIFLLQMLMVTAPLLGVRLSIEREEMERKHREELFLTQQRASFARDVHDLLGQSLTAITLQAQVASRLIDKNPQAARAELDGIIATARDSLTEVRAAVTEINRTSIREQLLHAREILFAANIRAELPDVDALPKLALEVDRLFAMCLREAVTNVVRHSRARHCVVTLAADRLTISDDGVGFTSEFGNGLSGLRARAAERNMELSVTNTHPGTTVEVS
ncbi:sensor histidine kinase [Corynebacterium sp. TAE3-ERU12]|uniref:sensor histidine kinase n=1 Tax=Corynebacterium sp. TAE3-ERU12 TaxID=2849491 RepID=UPI001C436E5B|nr:sensor histidine kinase [Corynebacterium sp. TAE3-ERU12]MBV7295556.1 sensor histidine kinase [Corynebacterium sp. TAE3-ERU12]